MDGTRAASAWTLPQQRSLPEVVAERIVEAIRSGQLAPGDRIVELTLARELGVSRGPLREALKVLEANHLVESRRGRGTFVTRVSDDDLVRMVTLRANLEGFAARFVATRFTDAVDSALSELLGQSTRAAHDGRTSDWRDLDWRFHETVVAAADNGFLLAAWRSIGNLVRLFLHTHPVFETAVGATLSNHDTLLEALRSGDPDQAEHAFRSVILASAFRRFDRPPPRALAAYGRDGAGKAAAIATAGAGEASIPTIDELVGLSTVPLRSGQAPHRAGAPRENRMTARACLPGLVRDDRTRDDAPCGSAAMPARPRRRPAV